MPVVHPKIEAAAEPQRKIFDPWNSASTGHQRAENRLSGSTSWRHSRTAKLRSQFSSGPGGGKRMFDSVGAGSKDFGRDGRRENGSWEKGAPGLREEGWRDIGTMLTKGGKAEIDERSMKKGLDDQEFPETKIGLQEEAQSENEVATKQPKGVFSGLAFYINGSTAPTISDHRLKQLISENGGRMALGLARRSVTHCIIGKPNGSYGGAGGGLSGTKFEKEIQRVRGCAVQFINVEWVLQSIKQGKRLPEHRYSGVSIAPKGVSSVVSMFKSQEKKNNSKLVDGKDVT